MAYSRYKKYYKDNKIIEGAKKKKSTEKKIDLSNPLPLKNKKLSKEHQKLIKNALIIQQRQFKRISKSNSRTEQIFKKHNEIMRVKPLNKVMDIFLLLGFFD